MDTRLCWEEPQLAFYVMAPLVTADGRPLLDLFSLTVPGPCRFSDNVFVLEEPKLAFYLAAPLVTTNGHRLGTLCVVGQKARRFSAEEANMLAGMAELVVRSSAV